VFPEALIGGYPKGLVFGASVGIRTAPGRQLFAAYANGAIEVPGSVTAAIGQIAERHQLFLVVGVIERDGGTLYCTALYFGPDGSLLSKHRKLTPTAMERIIWGCGDGTTLTVIDSPFGRIGGLICWENYMPLARVAMYMQGVQLYCAPTVDDREVWIPTMRHIAREGRCFVLSSCQFMTRNDYPREWLTETHDLPDVPIRGGSCIVNPMGEVIAGPLYDQPGILAVEISLGDLTEAKFDFDVVGHYARPDVFNFSVRV
jgi:nitrilase